MKTYILFNLYKLIHYFLKNERHLYIGKIVMVQTFSNEQMREELLICQEKLKIDDLALYKYYFVLYYYKILLEIEKRKH